VGRRVEIASKCDRWSSRVSSLANSRPSAAIRSRVKRGAAIAERMAMITTTTITSTSV
jgi:hypothetical protein